MTEQFKLNDAQQRAVDITNGPVLVVAGAGTGKTRVIVERIIHLIESGVSPDAILALTFTEKAAAEMQDRVSDARGSLTLDTTIATFNRFGNDLLTQYGSEWGLGRLRLLGDTGQLVFLREHFDDLALDYFAPVSNPDGQLENLSAYLSLLKQQLVTPEQYNSFADQLPASDEAEKLDKQKHQELAQFFNIYLNLCRQEQVIDYDDQLYLTIDLLKNRPNILKQLQAQYQYILVDEFQDTNPMQSKLVDLLAANNQNIMVVGDDDQSIYGWRGATLSNILDFKQRYPKVKDVTLIENYRSTQAILDCAYRLIQCNNPHRLEIINNLDKELRGQSSGPEPILEHFNTYEAELAWVAEDISRRLKKGQAPGSIAVLARRNQGVQKIHEALELHGVEHVVAGLSNDMYTQTAVQQLLEALKTIADPLDSMALFHTLSGPLFELPVSELAAVAGEAQRIHQPLHEAISNSDNADYQTALDQITTWQRMSSEQSVGNVAYSVVTDTGWKAKLYEQAKHSSGEVANDIQALSTFFGTLKEFERIAGVASVQNYVASLPVLKAAGNQFEDPTLDLSDNLVNVLSTHRSKGLEWDTVYIIDCTEGSFPLRARGASLSVPEALQANPSAADDHMAEERRLMYVALTRSRRELILSYADHHGSGALRKPSRFLSELLGHEPTAQAAVESVQTSLELFSPKSDKTTINIPENMQKDNSFMLSVSQIETWLRCPQDFYYKYVLAMPLPPAPQLTYGTVVHGIIEQIHQGRKAGQIPSLATIKQEVIENLPQAGYQSKRSRERAHAQALKSVESIYERFTSEELPIEAELPFSIQVPDLPLTIRGRIDAVYKSGQGVEIRDYKTGTSVRTPQQAKSRVSSSQQLTLYALAWQVLRGELPAKLSLDFVETGQIYGVKKQPKSLETLQLKLADMVKNLQANKYPPASDHKYCMHPIDSN